MRKRGSALVEFALVAPILILLILLMVQYGIIMNRMLTLSHAAREAARYAAVHPEDDETIRGKARGAMRGRGYRQERMSINIEPAQGSPDRRPGRPIKVRVQYDMADEMFLPTRFFGIQIINPVVTVEATAMIE
ncbi:MAG: pilus assembly protein [Armatimonadetes bacterium]|nr:pilus assembly protein [Armatimonadota bacterium]MCX7968059.1 pilus assembly protein [Armatimonadota bacterium]MDW8143710.1 TadE/TadG family type IV pilus assembly protein [Armatimonadota bacterium]